MLVSINFLIRILLYVYLYSICILLNINFNIPRYLDAACNVEIMEQNAFLPSTLYGCFDKVYVGASCPDERI